MQWIWMIYIPLWLDLLYRRALLQYNHRQNLHSTMVRFIIQQLYSFYLIIFLFTFHYGQIYYANFGVKPSNEALIYIPLWLDLLLVRRSCIDLFTTIFTFHYGQIYYKKCGIWGNILYRIYIPLWLDLLLMCCQKL